MKLVYDAGRKYGKALTENNKFLVTSGYSRSHRPTDDDTEIQYDGMYYNFNKDSKAEASQLASDRMFVSANYAAARMAYEAGVEDGTHIKVTLAVNIILDEFKNKAKKEAYREYFENKSQAVVYKENLYTVEFVKVYVYPQGLIMYLANRQKYAKYRKLAIYCIGSRSKELAIVNVSDEGKVTMPLAVSLRDGILTLFDRCKDLLRLDDIDYEYDDIDNVIRGTGDYYHPKAMLIRNVINAQFEDYASECVDELTQRNIDAGMPLIVSGGGGDLVAEAISDSKNVIETGGIWSNAEGCLKMMMAEEMRANGKKAADKPKS